MLQEWSRRLVFPREPFLVTEADRSLLPPGAVVHSWAELRDTHGSAPLELWDAYGLYGVRRAETQVALISGAELRSLPAEAQRTLRFRQWERGRTQIYRPEVAPGDPVETPDGLRHMLHHDTWTRLSRAEQQRILLAFAAEGNEPGIPYRGDDPVVRLHANTFAERSGPNCFATALAAVTPSVATAASIADLWLHPEPFLRGLAERGFAASDWSGQHEADSVLVWFDGQGRPQHACYLLPDGLALNKDAQAWFRPRQVLPLAKVLTAWADAEYQLRLYRRE
jgi:hypothetical protein